MRSFFLTAAAVIILTCPANINAQNLTATASGQDEAGSFPPSSQWYGKRAAYLGDSVTDAAHIGTTRNYWQDLQDFMGIQPVVYAMNGAELTGVLAQAKRLSKEHPSGDGEIDAIFVFAGTNDYNSGTPLGEWFSYSQKTVNVNGEYVRRQMRNPVVCDSTFRGRINAVMSFLKSEYPDIPIILMTPLHRSYARFGERNVQPDEAYCNSAGLYIDDYVEALREASSIWSVPVIDLFRDSGLLPSKDSQTKYFHDPETDRLHPNALGHRRIALTIAYSLLGIPSEY